VAYDRRKDELQAIKGPDTLAQESDNPCLLP
jgi:hypothetical protein